MARHTKQMRTPKQTRARSKGAAKNAKQATRPNGRTIGLTLAAVSAMAVGVWQALRRRVAARPA